MSDNVKRYTIEVSATELEVVSLALGRMPDAKPVRAKKAPAAAPEPFTPDTGDAALDAFMRRARERCGAPKPRRKPPVPKFPHGCRPMTSAQRVEAGDFARQAVTMWRERGHVVLIEPVEILTRLEGGQAGYRQTETPLADFSNVRVLPLGARS